MVLDIVSHRSTGAAPRRGHPETTFFIDTVFHTAQTLIPLFQKILPSVDRRGLVKWAQKQQLPLDDYYLTASRHIVYRLLVKLLFYHTLTQFRADLDPLVNLEGTRSEEFQGILDRRFSEARTIDYEAVFGPRFADGIAFTPQVSDELKRFCASLNKLLLTRMTTDVIGHLFEALLPEETKKQLGQYFTEDRVADLLVTFAIRKSTDVVFDPTCGTGGILLRAYSFLASLTAEPKHAVLLEQVWGNDVSDLPVELATVNLFTQDPATVEEFPRIISCDLFDVSPASHIHLIPARAHQGSDVRVPLPLFDAVVGNPPYVRRQDIGNWTPRPKSYRERLWKSFPEIRNHQADYYVFVFLQTLKHLRPGGRLAFITSNSWLEAEYGLELQRVFLRTCKIVAILESRCEAWFDKARVNTVVTVLEKLAPADQISAVHDQQVEVPSEHPLSQHLAKFVTFKAPLSIVVPGSAEQQKRFMRYVQLVTDIEDCCETIDTSHLRVRARSQLALLREIPRDARISKWGHYLRGPGPFERLLTEDRDRIVSLDDVIETRFGTLTGWNGFYCPRESEPGYQSLKEVEEDYKVPLLRSIKDVAAFRLALAQCKGRLFTCRSPRSALRGTKALNHIQWGEQRRDTHGRLLYRTGEMENRDPWYRTRDPVTGDVVFQMFVGERHFSVANPEGYAITNNSIAGIFRKRKWVAVGTAILNSVWFFLTYELYGRVNLGEGALKLEKIDLETMPLPSLDRFIGEGFGEAAVASFALMVRRAPKPVAEEVLQQDRQMLDDAVFDYFGLSGPERSELRDALVQLVSERVMVARARRYQQEGRLRRDTAIVEDDVREEVLGDGLRRFPEDFLRSISATKDVNVPARGLVLDHRPSARGQHSIFDGQSLYRLSAPEGYSIAVEHPEEAQYLHFAQNGEVRSVRMPVDYRETSEVVRAYRAYLERLLAELRSAAFARCFSHARAVKVAADILEREGIPRGPLTYKGKEVE